MKLEIGKRYVRRDGEITAPLSKNHSKQYPFNDNDNANSYSPSGDYDLDDDADCPFDLISEYIEPSLSMVPDEIIEQAKRIQAPQYIQQPPAPKSETLAPGVDQIPFESLEEIGSIFAEGEIKYGLDNWKQQPDNLPYDKERTRHAIRHLMLYANGDRSENHVAKVAWWAVTTIWRNKQCQKQNPDL